MKQLHLLCIGKCKDKQIIHLENEYLKRINFPSLKIHELKSSDHCDKNDVIIIEKYSTLSHQTKSILVLLDERGNHYNSQHFSNWLTTTLENNIDHLYFAIGGAEGHGEQLKKLSNHMISLSNLTFPHSFARLFFIEQIYRAQTIHMGHPYHK